jgi:hypothetical protein
MRVSPQVACICTDVNQHVHRSAGEKKRLCNPGRNKEPNSENAHDDYNSLERDLQAQPIFFIHFDGPSAAVAAGQSQCKNQSVMVGIEQDAHLEPWLWLCVSMLCMVLPILLSKLVLSVGGDSS